MYSLLTFRKAKGIPQAYVRTKVNHEQYVDVLNHWKRTNCKFRAFRSKRHRVATHQLYKVCLSCIDDKRYLLEDSVHSLAYGHYATAAGDGDGGVPPPPGTPRIKRQPHVCFVSHTHTHSARCAPCAMRAA